MLGRTFATLTLAALALLAATPAAFAGDWRHNDDRGHPSRHHDSDSSWSQRVGHDRSTDRRDRDDSRDRRGNDGRDDEDSDSGDAGTGSGTILTGTEKTTTAELTAYAKFENNPPGTAEICCGVIHGEASGTGSFSDPITAATAGSGNERELAPGTRIYIPDLAVYVLIEDSGATSTGNVRLDIWVDGSGLANDAVSDCMDRVTRTTEVIIHPADGKPVGHVGPLADASGCHVATSGS